MKLGIHWKWQVVGLFARCLAHIIVTLAKIQHPNAQPPFDYVDDLYDVSGTMIRWEEKANQ